MFKKIIASLAVIALMSGCSNSENEPDLTPDEKYVSTLHDRTDTFDDADEELLIDAGHNMCDYFIENGVSERTVEAVTAVFIAEFGYSDTQAILDASTGAYCPEVKQAIETLGSDKSNA